MEIPVTDDFTGNNFNYCNFAAEDYDLLADFFQMAHAHAIGEIPVDQLQDIGVS